MELVAATKEAEVLLKEISENTMIAEKEKARVAVIVDSVTQKAQVIPLAQCSAGVKYMRYCLIFSPRVANLVTTNVHNHQWCCWRPEAP